MWQAGRNIAFVVLMASMSHPHVLAQGTSREVRPVSAPVVTPSRILQASIDRISEGSALWRAAMEEVSKTGRYALIVTPDDPILGNLRKRAHMDSFDPGDLAEVRPVLDADSEVIRVLVIVNLPLIQRAHDARWSVPREFEGDVDRIMVHEVYGHAVPYLLAGALSGRCADPAGSERATDACSIRRENAVRAELGLGRRADPGLSSLRLAWGRPF